MADEVKVPCVTEDFRTDQNFRSLESGINTMRRTFAEMEAEMEVELGLYLRADGSVPLTGSLIMAELASAPDALANYGKLYVKSSDSGLYFKNDSGNEYAILPPPVTSGKIYVTSDVTNTTQVMANVTGMSFSVAANKIYGFELVLKVNSTAAGNGIWYQFTGPASPTSFWAFFIYNSALAVLTEEQVTAFSSPTAAIDQATARQRCKVSGYLINGNNAGTVQLQFRNENASQTVTVYAGSWGIWNKLN